MDTDGIKFDLSLTTSWGCLKDTNEIQQPQKLFFFFSYGMFYRLGWLACGMVHSGKLGAKNVIGRVVSVCIL